MAEPTGVPRIVKAIIWLIVLAALFFYLGKWIIGLFGGGYERSPVTLSVEAGSTVNVSVEGGLMQRTESDVPLYAEDKVSTGAASHATLSFFDETSVRLDEQTELTVAESAEGEEDSKMGLSVDRGAVWVRTPASAAGEVSRTVTTTVLSASVPDNTEALVTDNGLFVYSTDGLGLTVSVNGTKETVIIGEGQKFVLPSDADVSGDLYAYRSALDFQDNASPFVASSRGQAVPVPGSSGANGSALALTSPQDGSTVDTPTITVRGNVSTSVNRVRVNGLSASIDPTTSSFAQDLVVDADSFTIEVEALDAAGNVLATDSRTVRRPSSIATVGPPAITAPAASGGTYRTTEQEIVIRGTNGADVTGILVNDYRLQLFTPGKGTWSYLAGTQLGNMSVGTNVYEVYALDASGNKSDPARLTIVYDDGTLPPDTGSTASGGTASSAPAQADESTLPQNEPLSPGTLTVTGPTAGTAHTATGSEFLIEGTTSSDTASVWVNGYKLQLFQAGKTYWNYIAREAFGNLKKGTNVYKITVRNAKDEILDTVEYTVTY